MDLLMRRRMLMGMGGRKSEIDYSLQYLTFKALENGTFKFSKAGLFYSTNNGRTWTALDANTDTPTVNAGNKILFKGEIVPDTATGNQGIGTFSATGRFNASGNIMSLLYSDNFIGQTDLTGKDYAFYSLFKSNTRLIDANNLILPATILAQYCYNNMFNGCTSLTIVPALPATTLESNCYSNMFYSCSSLTAAPELPATTLASNCYRYMFYYCTSLTTAPELPATTLANYCYGYMFQECRTLTRAPELPATELAIGCYDSMFQNCRKLTTAPELPAITLVNNCYARMFYGCNKLNYIKAMFTTTPSTSYTNNWVSSVSSTGTFIKNSAATWDVTGSSGVPTGWTVQTADN